MQYFDKSRMEINDPSADPNNPFYVTNGLLTVELISGNMQIGAQRVQPALPRLHPRSPATRTTPTAPTYASFRTVASVAPGMGQPDADKRGQVATATIDRNGSSRHATRARAASAGATYVYYETDTQHNIPQVFWNFLNQQGPVIENGQTVTRQLIVPWFYASGYPISDAYWARVKIAGAFHDVLIQAFERRVLTYNPTNNAAFQVEMGNIGLHYYDWRYNNAGVCPGTAPPSRRSPPWAASRRSPAARRPPPARRSRARLAHRHPDRPSTPTIGSGKIVWVTKRVGGKRQIWQMNADGFDAGGNLTVGTDVENYDPAFSPDGNLIAFVSTRDGNPEIYTMTISGTEADPPDEQRRRPTRTRPGAPTARRSPSPATAATNNDIWVMNADGSGLINITVLPGNDRDPSWGSNDRIAFVSNRTGNDEIFAANPDGTALTATDQQPRQGLVARLVARRQPPAVRQRPRRRPPANLRHEGRRQRPEHA